MNLFYETDKTFDELMKEKKNFVFIGEAGSGKSEIVLNIAHMLAEQTGKQVDLFDLDQTKPLYRSRDMLTSKVLRLGYAIAKKPFFSCISQNLIVPLPGYTLLDIGGGHQAAKFAGSYSDLLSKEDSVPVYIVNPYRPWTRSIEGVDGTMVHILNSIRLDHIYILGNPNLGKTTTEDEFIHGLEKIDDLFEGVTVVNSACVRKEIYDAVKERTDKTLIPIDLYLTYEWID